MSIVFWKFFVFFRITPELLLFFNITIDIPHFYKYNTFIKSSGGYTHNMQNKISFNHNFDNSNDEEILLEIKNGNEKALEFLISKYKTLVNNKVTKYFIVGAEKEDIVQEGLIGLFKAIKDYNGNKQNSFKSFAALCIERQIITAIKTSNRQKHIPLNSSLSLNNTINDNDNETSFLEIIDAPNIEDPLETITKKEYYSYIKSKLNSNLSDLEKKVLYNYIEGKSYTNIAEKLDIPVKSIDNAIQRIRKKLPKI